MWLIASKNLNDNHLILIGPLKKRLAELELVISEKDKQLKLKFKRKLKKYKSEIENERKINLSLVKRICILADNTGNTRIPTEYLNPERLYSVYKDDSKNRGYKNQTNTQDLSQKYSSYIVSKMPTIESSLNENQFDTINWYEDKFAKNQSRNFKRINFHPPVKVIRLFKSYIYLCRSKITNQELLQK